MTVISSKGGLAIGLADDRALQRGNKKRPETGLEGTVGRNLPSWATSRRKERNEASIAPALLPIKKYLGRLRHRMYYRIRTVVDTQIAVLGGGISGCITACLLSDAGYDVVREPDNVRRSIGVALQEAGAYAVAGQDAALSHGQTLDAEARPAPSPQPHVQQADALRAVQLVRRQADQRRAAPFDGDLVLHLLHRCEPQHVRKAPADVIQQLHRNALSAAELFDERDTLLELRQNDLAFTTEEASQLLQTIRPRPLKREQGGVPCIY